MGDINGIMIISMTLVMCERCWLVVLFMLLCSFDAMLLSLLLQPTQCCVPQFCFIDVEKRILSAFTLRCGGVLLYMRSAEIK